MEVLLTKKIVSKLSELWSGMFIPDSDLIFCPSRIPGSKRHRSRMRICSTDLKVVAKKRMKHDGIWFLMKLGLKGFREASHCARMVFLNCNFKLRGKSFNSCGFGSDQVGPCVNIGLGSDLKTFNRHGGQFWVNRGLYGQCFGSGV